MFFLTSFYAKNVFTVYNVFRKKILPMKTWKNRPQKLQNWPKSCPNLNSCSIKISQRATLHIPTEKHHPLNPKIVSYELPIIILMTLECMVVKQELLSICSCLYAQQAKTTELILLQLKYVCRYAGALKLAHLLR